MTTRSEWGRAWRPANGRAAVIGIGLVALVLAVALLSVRLQATRGEFLGMLAACSIVWLPTVWIRTVSYRRIAVVYAVALALVTFGFLPFVSIVLSLPTLIAAAFPPPPTGTSVRTPLLSGLAVSSLIIGVFAVFVIPARGDRVVICTDEPATEEFLVSAGISRPSGRSGGGYDLPPGATTFVGGPPMELWYPPFADDAEIEAAMTRARKHPLVDAVGRGWDYFCPPTSG